jgi:hypothetical protein
MKCRIAVVSLALAACLAKSKPVRMPDGQQALRIECNYSFDNCEREARRECDGDYERVTKGDMSCKDCGLEINNPIMYAPENDVLESSAMAEGNNVYKGVLYVRCK